MIYGNGRLLIDHRDVGFVEFKLTVTRPGTGDPYASGIILAHQSVIDDAMHQPHVEIVRDADGGLMRITVNSTIGDGSAQVLATGDLSADRP